MPEHPHPSAAAPHAMKLPDGRRLAWAEYGDPEGSPLFFHHGIPSSRLVAGPLDGAARRSGVRLIAPDRPGYGMSDPLPGRRIADWPRDLREIADYLELPKFSVAGVSAGLTYTLACALEMPERLRRVALISGLGRIDDSTALEDMSYEWRLIYSLFLKSPRLASLWMRGYGKAAKRRPERVVEEQIKRMPEVDGAILGTPEISENRIADIEEAFRQGSTAAAEESRNHLDDWGFEYSEIEAEVYLWQGTLDESHPLRMGREIAQSLPQCRPLFVDGAGALGFITHAEDIFNWLFAPAGGAPPPERDWLPEAEPDPEPVLPLGAVPGESLR